VTSRLDQNYLINLSGDVYITWRHWKVTIIWEGIRRPSSQGYYIS